MVLIMAVGMSLLLEDSLLIPPFGFLQKRMTFLVSSRSSVFVKFHLKPLSSKSG